MSCGISQRCYWFWGENDREGRSEPTDAEKRVRISRDNRLSPFSKFIGNERAVRKLQAAAYAALGDPMHMMRDLAFAIYGPASAGKTTLARIYADTVELPFVEISPKQVKKLDDVFRLINAVLVEHEMPLVGFRNKFRLPPCVVFFDEVHALSDNIVQGLLKATEYNDCVMATESGRILNTKCATWMMATTDEGRLFDAFRTRFSPVHLNYLTKSEISKIVKLAHPQLDDDVCRLVSHYNGRIPRKALEFARYMTMVRAMDQSMSWADVARQVAEDEGIDQFGMHELSLKVLKALADGAVAARRIPAIIGRKSEEVERNIMPVLMCATEDQPSLVTTSNKGYILTDSGKEELRKRGISIS